MTMNSALPLAFTYPAEYFSVRDTLECGQIFRYRKISDGVYGVFSLDKYAEMHTSNDTVSVYTFDADYFWRFFDLDCDYAVKAARISAISPFMKETASYGKGIRILNQDLTETIFSFIISANNNIKRIQLIIDRLCNRLGQDTPFGKAFPSLKVLADAPVATFSEIGAGYRDRYISETAKKLSGYDLSVLSELPSDAARKELLSFTGIGPKVADCILLFGMRRGDVCPVDTWLRKVYHSYFEQGHRDADISAYFCSLFGEDTGLCQQYLFYYQRSLASR